MAIIEFASSLANGAADTCADKLARDLELGLAGTAPELIAVFASPATPLSGLCALMRQRFPKASLIAATTAGEFTERGDAKQSVAACALGGELVASAGAAEGLSDNPEQTIARALAGQPEHVAGFSHKTAIMLLDPLAGAGEEATLVAAGLLGEKVQLAGGAAGDDLKMQHTEVACGDRVLSNAAVLAVLHTKQPLGLGVCHGHQPLSDELTVTRASGNTVYEIDGRPAWEVWVERTRASANRRGVDPSLLGDDEIGSFLLRYEAGLASGKAYKIRAPLTRASDGSLGFACGIPEGAVLRITESEPERQVASARIAAERAVQGLQGRPASGALVFDCICRNLILGAEFHAAIAGMSDALGGAPLAGFETYGEIALAAGDMSGFHNTTSVVLAFPS